MAREESFIPTQEEPYGIGNSIAIPATLPIVPGQGHPLIARDQVPPLPHVGNRRQTQVVRHQGGENTARTSREERDVYSYTAIQLNSQNLIKLLTK